MKKTLIAVALVSTFGIAHAQTTSLTTGTQQAPTAAQPATAQVPLSGSELKAGTPNMNPYTGVSKETEVASKVLDDLKRQKELSSQKLQLQRDELDALRIEVEKKKIYDTLNPPAPPKPPKEVKKIEKPKPVVIYPDASKNEQPVLVGVVTAAGQRVAMLEFDGRPLRATVGSTIAGKNIEDISANSVRWGGQYLNIPAKKGFATVVLNENEGPISRKKNAGNNANPGAQGGFQQTAAVAHDANVTSSSSTPTLPGTNIPMITPKGAGAPSGVFGLLPPPPPGTSK